MDKLTSFLADLLGRYSFLILMKTCQGSRLRYCGSHRFTSQEVLSGGSTLYYAYMAARWGGQGGHSHLYPVLSINDDAVVLRDTPSGEGATFRIWLER